MQEIILSMSSFPMVKEAGFVSNTKPFIPKSRTLPYYVLGYLTQGNMELIEDGETYELSAGSVLILSAGHRHCSTELTAPNTSWYYIQFYLPVTTDPLIDLKNFIPLSATSSLQPEDYHFALSLPKCIQLPPGNIIRKKLEKLVMQFESDSPLRFGYQNALLLEIFMDLLNTKAQIQHDNLDSSNINSLLHYLNDHVEDSFHSESIAAAMNLNYKYMCEFFKKKTGTTMQQYHTLLKMKEAERYLKTTELSIKEISSKLGYQDSLYFSNVFKKHHSISPRQYRQNNYTIKISK